MNQDTTKSLTYNQAYYQANKQKWIDWANSNRDKKNEAQRRYLQKNAAEITIKKNIWTSENWDYKLWSQAQNRARRDNIGFKIDRSDIVIPEYCSYLGCELTKIWGNGIVWTNASLDRIDNTKGYLKDNIRVISWLANSMKRDATAEQLVAFAKGVLAHANLG